jgi:hypothetical protein
MVLLPSSLLTDPSSAALAFPSSGNASLQPSSVCLRALWVWAPYTPSIDFWEINEALASQALSNVETLGLDQDKVDVQGGAIAAIGHPLRCGEYPFLRSFV